MTSTVTAIGVSQLVPLVPLFRVYTRDSAKRRVTVKWTLSKERAFEVAHAEAKARGKYMTLYDITN